MRWTDEEMVYGGDGLMRWVKVEIGGDGLMRWADEEMDPGGDGLMRWVEV